MTTQEKIGVAIVQLRQELGISQEKLALETSIGRRYMSDIENGKRNLSLDILERLAKYFKMPISDLFARAEAVGRTNPTLKDIKEWLCDRELEDSIVFENPDFVSAILGVSDDDRVVYSYNEMVEDLVRTEGLSYEDAVDTIDYNTIRSLPYMGEKAPVIVFDNPYRK